MASKLLFERFWPTRWPRTTMINIEPSNCDHDNWLMKFNLILRYFNSENISTYRWSTLISLYTSLMFLDLVQYKKLPIEGTYIICKTWQNPEIPVNTHTHNTLSCSIFFKPYFIFIVIKIIFPLALIAPVPAPQLHLAVKSATSCNCELLEQWFYKLFSVRPWKYQGIPIKQWYNLLRHSPNGWSRKLCFWGLVRLLCFSF